MPQTALVAATLLALAAGFVLLMQRRLRAPDEHDTTRRHDFLAAFDGETLPADLLVQTYEALSRRLPAGRAILPASRLAQDCGLGPFDVEDLALLVAARTRGRIPTARDLDALDASVVTVGDLVRFLAPFCTALRVA